MTKEEIVKELDKLGNVLYNKFGTDSYLERCTIHDLKAKIKVLIIADVVESFYCNQDDGEYNNNPCGEQCNFCKEVEKTLQ